MNEFTMLRDHGPEPTPLSEDVLVRARAALLTEIHATHRPATNRTLRLRLRRRSAVVAAAAATVAVVTGIVAAGNTETTAPPSAGEPPASQSAGEPHALVGFDMPTLPPKLTPIPQGLTEPWFTADRRRFSGVYHDTSLPPGTVAPAVTVMTYWDRPDIVGGQDTTYQGKPAVIVGYAQHSLSLVWERTPGQWVGLEGLGAYADEQTVRSLADTLVDTDEKFGLDIGVAPAGWELYAFEEAAPDGTGAVTSLRNPRDPDHAIHVSTVLSLRPNLGEVVPGGPVPTVPVTVNGRQGQLVQLPDLWMVEAPLANGLAFLLQVPADFSRQQVIELAESVS